MSDKIWLRSVIYKGTLGETTKLAKFIKQSTEKAASEISNEFYSAILPDQDLLDQIQTNFQVGDEVDLLLNKEADNTYTLMDISKSSEVIELSDELISEIREITTRAPISVPRNMARSGRFVSVFATSHASREEHNGFDVLMRVVPADPDLIPLLNGFKVKFNFAELGFKEVVLDGYGRASIQGLVPYGAEGWVTPQSIKEVSEDGLISRILGSLTDVFLPPIGSPMTATASPASFTGNEGEEEIQSRKTTTDNSQLVVTVSRRKFSLEITVETLKDHDTWNNKLTVVSVQRDKEFEPELYLIPMILDDVYGHCVGCIRIEDSPIENLQVGENPLTGIPDDVNILRRSIEAADGDTLKAWKTILQQESVEMSDEMKKTLGDILDGLS